MICETRSTSEELWRAERPPLKFASTTGQRNMSGGWQLSPRSRPKADGLRRITLEARSDLKTLNIDLTAGEAADLMFAIGFALEQAARDETRASHDRAQLETLPGGHA